MAIKPYIPFGSFVNFFRTVDDPRRLSRATAKNHIHNHRPTWLPRTRVAMTHAWYRRHGKLAPTRRHPKGWNDRQLAALSLMKRQP